jgi:hypothetical protein
MYGQAGAQAFCLPGPTKVETGRGGAVGRNKRMPRERIIGQKSRWGRLSCRTGGKFNYIYSFITYVLNSRQFSTKSDNFSNK